MTGGPSARKREDRRRNDVGHFLHLASYPALAVILTAAVMDSEGVMQDESLRRLGLTEGDVWSRRGALADVGGNMREGGDQAPGGSAARRDLVADPCVSGRMSPTQTTSMAGVLECRSDRGAEEARRAGDQDLHGTS